MLSEIKFEFFKIQLKVRREGILIKVLDHNLLLFINQIFN